MTEASHSSTPIILRYFAWVRERVGTGEEAVSIPVRIETVADLLNWQKARGDNFELAFGTPSAIRVAINHAHVRHDAPIAGAREIAFFPPVTGG